MSRQNPTPRAEANNSIGGSIQALYRYPLQGAGGQAVATMELSPAAPPPFDRFMGVVEKMIEITTSATQPIYKLRSDKELLTLRAHYDPPSQQLTLTRADGRPLVAAALPQGAQSIADAVAKWLGYGGTHPLRLGYRADAPFAAPFTAAGPPTIAGAYKKTAISIINRASITALARASLPTTATPIEEQRFRGNIYIDGAEPFAELAWIGQTITLGGATLRVVEPIVRCAITEINPSSGLRDLATLTYLKKHFQHLHMGVYAEVIGGGTIALGDKITAADDNSPRDLAAL